MDSSKKEDEWYNQDQSEVQIKDSFMESFILWSCFDCYERVTPFEHGLNTLTKEILFL